MGDFPSRTPVDSWQVIAHVAIVCLVQQIVMWKPGRVAPSGPGGQSVSDSERLSMFLGASERLSTHPSASRYTETFQPAVSLGRSDFPCIPCHISVLGVPSALLSTCSGVHSHAPKRSTKSFQHGACRDIPGRHGHPAATETFQRVHVRYGGRSPPVKGPTASQRIGASRSPTRRAPNIMAKKIVPIPTDTADTNVDSVPTDTSTDTADTSTDTADTVDVDTVPTFAPNTDMSVDGVRANLILVGTIDKHLSAVAGTVVAKGKAATLSVELAASELASKVDKSDMAIDTLVSVYNIADTLADIHPLIAVGFIDDVMSDLSDRRADYGAKADGLVRDILKATAATSDTTTALIAQRSAIVGLIGAMSNVLDQMGTTVTVSVPNVDKNGKHVDGTPDMVDVDVPVSKGLSVPTAPKIPGVASASVSAHSNAPAVSVKNGSFYVVKNGNRHHYSNDSLSYLAYKFGVDVDALTKALSDKNVDTTSTFETTLTVTGVKSPQAGKTNTWTFGLVVTDK